MNEYLANIIDSANEGIYVTDPDRRFLLWNEAAERISGYRKSEMIGRCCFDNILSHSDAEGNELCLSRCPLKAAIDDGKPHGPVTVYLRHKDGRRIAVEVKTAPIRNDEGAIVGGVEIFQDVTERIEQERLLRERKEKLETVLDSIGDGILFLNTEGRITVINRSCAEMFALDKNATGIALESLPTDRSLTSALSQVGEAFKGSLLGELNENRVRCPDGKGRFRCWTAAMAGAAPGARTRCRECAVYGAVRAFLEEPREFSLGERSISVVSSFIELRDTNELWEVIVFHDVTAEKLDAALKVAGAAAHELRQPLQVIIILAGLLEKDLKGNASLLKHLEAMTASCERMDGIIKKMTEITKYRTKEYIGGRKILDIEHSSNKN
jgi:PAS domain S-box-containing protein